MVPSSSEVPGVRHGTPFQMKTPQNAATIVAPGPRPQQMAYPARPEAIRLNDLSTPQITPNGIGERLAAVPTLRISHTLLREEPDQRLKFHIREVARDERRHGPQPVSDDVFDVVRREIGSLYQ